MIYLRASQSPTTRLRAIEASAREESRTPRVIELARMIIDAAPHYSQTERAAQLLSLMCAPSYPGNFLESAASAGQYIDTDVINVFAHGGDCVERSHALVALAFACGLRATPVWVVERPNALLDHVVTQIFCDGVWQWADPLPPCRGLGSPPQDAVGLIGRM